MCGIFGYIGESAPAPALLTATAAAASRRGPHGWGWVWHGEGPGLFSAHYTEPLARHLERLTVHPGCRIVLGHARLATVGDWRRQDQLQPVVISSCGVAVAHNGVINNADVFEPCAATDSIALARAYAAGTRGRGTPRRPPAAQLATLLTRAQHAAWVVVVLDGDALYCHRRYHPLWRLAAGGGHYLSSQQFHPDAQLVPEDRVVSLSRERSAPRRGLTSRN